MLDLKSKFQRVMLIDNNTIDLYLTSKIMTKNNFGEKIEKYTSAIKALTFLQENQADFNKLPQIIFVDIYMPQMSGFEFMLKYDKLSSDLKKYCKVYIISSSIDEYDIKRAKDDLNIVAFQVKTITKEFLESISSEQK
ncbi:Response regulator receiver domain-containing protein [Flavobacterium segetis]|uniref:Response regulator receiver domain-containing protein n=1 Tax=Flavobacterium segetis TaxID=271157 RepID=A0A1M5ISA2_9FLAO|nr:response regulator [Flavobacterium segetis]SHG31214.1 Response regulator receiver domain-containing protein [Flavobacterium segetis]